MNTQSGNISVYDPDVYDHPYCRVVHGHYVAFFSGFTGLFTGTIIVSIGYKILIGWLNTGNQSKAAPVVVV